MRKAPKILSKLEKDTPREKRMYINKDYTFNERQKNKELRQELRKKKEETKDSDWIIRGDKIVRKSTTRRPNDMVEDDKAKDSH